MRRYFVLFCCLFLCGNALAQKHFRFAGYVQLPNDPLVSYYLEFTVTGNTIKGYSITGYKDGNRLKAAVEGYMTTQSDMFIRETAALDNTSAGLQTICYFSAHLKLTIMMNGRQRWNGSFQSHQANGVPCIGSGGVMTVTDNAPPLDEVPKPNPKPVVVRVEMPKPPPPLPKQKVDTPKMVPPPVVQKPKDTPKIVRVVVKPEIKPAAQPEIPKASDSCKLSYDWNSDDFVFDIWDGYTIDGDVVSLSMSGRSLLQRVKLDEKKQHFTIPLTKGLNILYIYLHEEGFDPPNTPNLTLYDGSKKYELAVSGNTGEIARVCIWRK